LNLKLKFLPFLLYFAPARAFLHVLCNPSHTLTCLPPTYLLFHLAHFPDSSSFFSFCYYGVCLPYSLYCKYGNTALMMASRNGRTATVQLLLEAGADKDAKSKVRERKRENYTHKWLSKWFEGGSNVWPLFTSLELRLVPHVAWGLA